MTLVSAMVVWACRRHARLHLDAGHDRAAGHDRVAGHGERARDEAGSTLLEMAISSAVLGLVLTSVLSLMTTAASNERFQQGRVSNQEAVRLVMIEAARDLRNANPMLPLPDATSFATSFEVATGPTEGPRTYVRWSLIGHEVVRETLTGPGGTAITSTVRLTGINTWSLRYFDRHDAEITSEDLPGDFVNCTERVVILVSAGVASEAKAFTEAHDVQLRNHVLDEEEDLGC
ncbi:MAG: hypothetical protein HYR89_06680 [Actinobacteria bacterium]|nr:hypothetical protein [Actinomycetota bacterium]